MNLTKNYFELFGVSQQFDVDTQKIVASYRELQRQFHPDKFTSHSAAEQKLAVQFSAHLNSALQVLKSPVLRAEYLLALAGQETDYQSTTISDAQFLMMQLEWRETLADIAASQDIDQAESDLEQLDNSVAQQQQLFSKAFNQQYVAGDYPLAQQTIAKLHFVDKMSREIVALEATLSDH